MKVSWVDYSQLNGNIKNVPNQSVTVMYCLLVESTLKSLDTAFIYFGTVLMRSGQSLWVLIHGMH